MNFILRWSKKEYPLPVRISALAVAGALFLFLIPYTLIVLAPRLDTAIHLPSFDFGWPNIILGGLMILGGMVFGLWSVGMEIFDAGGTPLPLMPTQKLLTRGAFRYCRNPMTFGTVCAYSGIGVLAGSLSAVIIVAIFAGLLILYVKRIEEKELAVRFGQAYLDYLASTPFIIPRLWKRM